MYYLQVQCVVFQLLFKVKEGSLKCLDFKDSVIQSCCCSGVWGLKISSPLFKKFQRKPVVNP